ncbi:MAG: SURF1 family protein [Rhodovarius sp.]|nr:SURF1 family protein [Rhodovarius sp.]
MPDSAAPEGRPVWRRLLLPALLALPVLALLLGLGTWQLQRLAWKTALLAELAAAQAGPPGPADAPAPFAHIEATGRFRHDLEVLLGAEVRGTVLGARLITPLEREGAPTLLIERGWVPQDLQGVSRPEGIVTLRGYMRPPERRGLFAARDDAARRHVFTFDPAAIGAMLGIEVAPFGLTVVEEGPARREFGLGAAPAPHRGPLPDPARGFPAPPNPHLGYALTWYGLALAWVVIFALWAARRIREP